MRQVIWLGLVGAACMSAAAATTACGGSGGAGGAGGNDASSSSAASGGSNLVNGCDPAKAEDHTADTSVTIAFPDGVNLVYKPPCIKVKAGTKLVFNGDFSSHPLNGGLDGMADTTSPITLTNTGMTATFTLPTAGTVGWFCGFHQSLGMQGAAFVQ